MARFRYTAADADGKSVSGFVESDSIEQAREQLESQGLSPVEVTQVSKTPDPVQAEAASQAGQLMAAGIPLSAGLRALAEETDDRSLARVLLKMADRLDAGDDINAVFSGESLQIPTYLKGLVHAGTQMGDLAGGIEHYVQFGRLRARIRNRIRVSLAYPLALLSISLLVMFAALFLVLPQFKSIFDGFGVELPGITSMMLNLSTMTVLAVENWPITIVLGAMLPVGAWYCVKNLFGPPAWRRFLYLIPLVGPTMRYGALAEYCHLLAILIDHGLPLPEALELAGEGVSDWNLREGSYVLSKQVETGNRPGHGDAVSQFPRDILNVMSWDTSGAGGQSVESPGDALRGAGEIYSAHAEVHSCTITAAMEPAAIFLVACLASLLVISLFLPMIKLLNDLS